MELLTPDTLINGRYRVSHKIGQGGMGAVYEAIDERLRNRVALKQTLVEGETFSRAFEREAQLLASLRHPALPRVIDHFVDERGQFLVMDYIEGDDLATLLKTQGAPFSVNEVLRWADLLLTGLEYLHTHEPPIIHRDIKPQNIKLTPQGQLVLLDFGLAKGNTVNGQPTRASLFGYTPQFAPLEQVQGTGTDARSDIYSVGATLYNLLTAQSPTDVISRAAALLNRQPDPLRPVHELNPAVSPMLSGVISQAMSMAADERFATVAAMRRALNAAGAAPGPRPTVLIPAEETTAFYDEPPAFTSRPISRPPSQPGSRPPSQPGSRPPSQPGSRPPSQPEYDASENDGFAPSHFDDYPQRRKRRGPGFATGCLVSLVLAVVAVIAVSVALIQGLFRAVGNVDDATVETAIGVFSTLGPTIDAAINPPKEQTANALNEAAEMTAEALEDGTEATSDALIDDDAVQNVVAPTTSQALAPGLPTPVPTYPALDALNLTNNAGRSDEPVALADRSGNLHLIWRDNSLRTDGLGEDLLYRQRNAAGEWSANVANLSEGFALFYGDLQLLERPDGAICAFWSGARVSTDPTTIGLYQRCLSNTTWDEAVAIKSGADLAGRRDYRLIFNSNSGVEYLSISGAGTLLFNNQIELGDGVNLAYAPQLTIDGSGVYHALWVVQSEPFQLLYAHSLDGNEWSEPATVNDERNVPSGTAQRIIADNAGNIHVAWAANGEIYYRKVSPVEPWSEISSISNGVGRIATTSLGLAAGSDGRAHIAWQGDGVTYAEQGFDGSWSTPRPVNAGLYSGSGPTIAVDPQGKRHIIWQDSENKELFYVTIIP
jgi:serine/threonine protein kinase